MQAPRPRRRCYAGPVKPHLAIGIAAALAAGAIFWWLRRGGDDRGGEPAEGSRAAASAPVPGASSPRPTTPGAGAGAATVARARRLPDAAARARLVDEIRRAQQQRTAGTAGTSAPTASGSPPPVLPDALDARKEFIRTATRELIPLLVECYDEALARDDKLAGTITVAFTIEGEPGVGGVIGQSQIDADASDLADPAMRECIQETMYAIEIAPPPDGETVQVRYPFKFAP